MFFYLLSVALADLPVHCLRHQVTGGWTFHTSELSSTRTKCGHQSPDAASAQPVVNMADYTGKVEVHLSSPSSASSDGEFGQWTMVYDEGFEVKIGAKTFFAFNSFDGAEEADGNVGHYKSYCSKTQVGWFSEGNQYGCFVATREDGLSALGESSTESPVRWESNIDQDKDWAHLALGDSMLLQERVYTAEEHQNNVDKINTKQTGWKAAVYPHLLNKTHMQLSQMSGIRRSKGQRTQRSTSFLQKDASTARVDSYPKDFDWHNKDGKDYVPHVINQGNCGSCYVVSSVSMMTARRRILEDNVDAEPFSTQIPLFCGEYTQGCDGGYPELVAKWSHDVALLPESCGAYEPGNNQCRINCDASSAQYKVGEYGYVGGFYGASKEANIMDEIYQNGPVAIAIEPQDDFMYYSSGVYEHSSAVFDEWTKVDHAVLMTGWGEDDGKKYWRVQNSWGATWGENGSFRIRRGVDESAVEAQVVFANIVKNDDHSALGAYS